MNRTSRSLRAPADFGRSDRRQEIHPVAGEPPPHHSDAHLAGRPS